MAEYIYIAESQQYPGMVKIGRTDRTVDVRMEELSDGNYGLPGNEVDAEWEAVKIIKVEDNEHAEAVLHEFYADQRVTDSRELFYTNDIDALGDEAISVVNGVDIIQTFDSSDALFDALGIVSIATGLVITASIFSDHPNIKKAEKFMDDWEKRLETKYSQSKSLTGKAYYGFLNWSFGISKIVGGMLPFMAKEMSEAIKVEIRNAEYKKEQEKKIKKQQKNQDDPGFWDDDTPF